MGMFDSLFGGSKQSSAVWGPQADALEQLYSSATGNVSAQQGYNQWLMQDLMGQSQAFSQDLLGISSGNNPFMQGLAGFSSGAQTSAAVDALGFNVARQLEQQILPALGSEAIFAGTYGQDRSQIAQGMAAQGAMDAIASGAAQIGLQGMNAELAAMTSGAGLQAQAGLAGQSGILDMFNLGMGGSPLSADMMLAQILGGPAILGSGSSSSGILGGLSDMFSFTKAL